jgi:hypothetical protein
MFFADSDSSMRTSPPIAFDDAPDPGVRDAKPIDLWDAWLFAEAEASLMLEAWLSAGTADKGWTHAGYRAALDREEQAARVLADRLSVWVGQP